MNDGLSPTAEIAQAMQCEPDANSVDSSIGPPRLRRVDYIVIGLVVAVVRAAFSWGRTSFTLSPDEIAVGGMARFLSGTDSFNMLIANTWRPGLSTLLAPTFWFTSDPELFVRIGLIANAVIAGIGAMWLARLGQRLTRLSSRGLVVTATAVSVMPASLSASSFVWAEPLITLSFLAGTWYVLRCYDDVTIGTCTAAIGWSLVGLTAHGRMLPFVVLVTGAVAAAALTKRRWKLSTGAVCFALSGAILSAWYANFVFDAVWEVHTNDHTVGSVLSRLRNPVPVVQTAIGQLWYLMVSTATLFGLGAYVLIRSAVGRRRGVPKRSDALVLLVLTVPMLVMSIVFTSDRGRSDFFVYGRYNDAIVAPIIIVAAAWLVLASRSARSRTWWWLVGGMGLLTLELGLLANQLRGDALAAGSEIPMISGLQPLAGPAGSIDVIPATAASLAISSLLFWTSRMHVRPQQLLAAIATTTLIAAGVMAHRAFSPWLDMESPASVVTQVEGTHLKDHQPVLVGLIPQRFSPQVPLVEQRARALLYQWYLPGHEFGLLLAEDHQPGTMVFATPEDAYLGSIGAIVVWHDPGDRMDLWQIGQSPPSE